MGCQLSKPEQFGQNNNQLLQITGDISLHQLEIQDSNFERLKAPGMLNTSSPVSGDAEPIKQLSSNFETIKSLDLIEKIESLIKQTQSDSNIVSHESWTYALSKFKNFSFNADEKLDFINFIDDFFRTNYKIKKIEISEEDYCKEFGQKLHLFQNRLFWKLKRCLEHLKVITNPDKHKERPHLGFFLQLKFDMDFQETKKVAFKGRMLFQNDMDSFSFLTLYFQISIQNKLKNSSILQVQKELTKQIVDLQKIYPANDAQIKIPEGLILKDIKTEAKYFQRVDFNKGLRKSDQLKSFILGKVEHAKAEYKMFEKLVKDLCYEFGYGFKCGLKIKNSSNQASIFRTIEKLMEKEEFEKHFKELVLKFQKQYEGQDETWKSDILKAIEYETKEVQDLMSQLLESQSSILLDAKDLLRGKCIFTKIEEIINTANKLIHHIKKEGHEVIELKNRLNKHTKDVVLIIKLPNSIAELQLALKLNSVANEFNHKLYELERSKTYTPITNLLIHNKKWGQAFFTKEYELFKEAIEFKSEPPLQEGFTLKQFREDLQAFKVRILDPNKIICGKSKTEMDSETNKVNEKLNQLKELIDKNKYEKADRKKKNEHMINETQFFFKNLDYEKALCLLGSIPEEQLIKNRSLLVIKGDILLEKGQLNDSLNCYLKAEELLQLQERQTIQYANLLKNIGKVYHSKGNYDEALKHYHSCLEIQTKINGNDSIDVTTTLNCIGKVYYEKGNYDEALKHYNRCLQIQSKIKGSDSIDVTTTLKDMGSVYQKRGNHEEALKNYNRCLEIQTKIKGSDSIDVASTLSCIGMVHFDKRQYHEASKYYNICLEIQTKIKGSDSIDVALTLKNIGDTVYRQGFQDVALKHYSRCLEIQLKTKGSGSIDVASVLIGIGNVYLKKKNYDVALKKYNRCLEIQTKIKGSDSIDVTATLNNIGNVYQQKGNHEEALKHYNKCLQIRTKIKGSDSIDVAQTLYNLALLHRKMKKIQEAHQSAKRSHEIRQLVLGFKHRKTQQSQQLLRELEFKLQNMKEFGYRLG